MSKNNACGTKSCHELAIDHIVTASKRALENKHDQADYHLEAAKTFADMHHKRLLGQGLHNEAQDYRAGIDDHVSRVKAMRSSMKKADTCKADHTKLGKNDICKTCGTKGDIKKDINMDDNIDKGLKKGFLPGTPSLPKLAPTGSRASSGNEIQRIGKPKADARYDHKPIHELHPHDQKIAQEKFGRKDMGAYNYPVDKGTGRLVHAARSPATEAPKAHGSSYPEVQPHHSPGATVEIRGVNGHHGKMGIVHGSNPEMPGKIAVQVGHREHEKIFVEPHQVVPRKPTNRIEKAMVTLSHIRKVLMKSEGSKPPVEVKPHSSHEEMVKLGPSFHNKKSKEHQNHAQEANKKSHEARRAGNRVEAAAQRDLQLKHHDMSVMHDHYGLSRTASEEMRPKHLATAQKRHKELS